ncbi:MAG TPA: PKD domain-containing protein [Ferruginibacter sp.]|nr:PKD domain-containing protein [Ferruginibacter sp.]HRE63302.1 PKD domain-containing protein [Ferruginibacter sp.]
MRKLFLTLLLVTVGLISNAQNFSNKGKDFWVAYGYHQIMTNGNAQNMVLYFATDQITSVTVSIPGLGYSQTYSNIPANTVFTSAPLPKTGAQDARLLTESTSAENKGIHIVADKPIVAYAHIYNQSVSGASILFPTNTLGKEYYSINYDNISNTNNANCWFYVIACDTGTTTVEIIPSANTLTHAAGVPFTVTLTQGQVYNFMGQLTGGGGGTFTGVDLTGSSIRSIASASGACKRIAVFSGSGRIGIRCDGTGGSSDNYMVQAFPKSAWGKKFLTAPTGGLPNNPFRIGVSNPAANVTVNGLPIASPLLNNFYYQISATSQPLKIESDLPITVAQYISSYGGCGNPINGNNGDPEVIYLSPVEQNISTVLWNATPNFNIQQHYYTVIIPNSGTAISSFKLDGVVVNPALFIPHPQDAAYSYLTQTVGSGSRRIESDSGFNAIAYGYGNAESYGYNAGTNVRDLLQQVGVSTQYGIDNTPSVCTGTPFKFKVSLPYLVDSMRWNLSGLPGNPANVLMTYSNPPVPTDADSTTIINGKTVYWYSIPSTYTFATVGTYPVVITAYASTAEGCGNEQEINFDLEINNPPAADFNWTHSGCIDQTVQFNDQTTSVKPTYKWWWNFGDPASGTSNISILQNPSHAFSAPGTYTVRFANITTPGCLSDTITKTIVINPLPIGNISGDITVCQNAASPNVVFTGTTGTAPFTFTYNVNNGAAQTITTSTGNSVNIAVPTNAVGTFNYHLVSIQDAAGTSGCLQNNPDTVSVVVNPLPTASVAGNITVCENATAPLVTFTAAGTVAPYTFNYNINGGPTQTITTSAGNSATVAAPTTTAGTFVYNLVSVTDASSVSCSNMQSGSVTVIVNPLPTASISGTTSVCTNAASPVITFTGAGSVAPYTFTYSINGGADQTISSGIGNTATITVPTNTAGTYSYLLKSVSAATTPVCSNLQSASAIITVHPLPTANFTVSTPNCVSRTISFTDNSTANVGTITSYSWNFGDPASGSNNTSTLQNPTHVYATAGNYTVTLSITNSEGCISSMVSQQLQISTLPTASFSTPEVCLLDPFAQFTDQSTAIAPSTVTAWSWNFGDPPSGVNNTSTIQNAQHTYNAVGNYNVTLVAITQAGCTDTLTLPLTVNGGNPQSNFIQLNANSSCSSDSIAIQNKSTIASGSITKVEIYWDNTGQPTLFETDDVPFFDKIYKYKYPTSTNTITYNVRFRAYSGQTCVSDRILPVTVLATPEVTINNIPDQCYYLSSPLVLNVGAETGGVVGTATYSGQGVSFNGTNWIFDPVASGIGTFNIQYKFIATAGGCADSISTSIKVLDTASARFTLQNSACEKNIVSFSDQSSAPASVTLSNTIWDFGDGSPAETHPAGGIVQHYYSSYGVYNVTMYNVSSSGCRSAATIQSIVVNPLPVPSFSFPASLCLPAASVTFNNTSSIVNGTENTFTYLWNFGDPSSGSNNTATNIHPTHVYYGAGPYSVNLQVTTGAGCVHDTSIVVHSIHPQPTADYSINKQAICIGDNVSFTSTANGADGAISSWHWNFDDGNSSTIANPTNIYSSANTYQISHWIVNSFGCNSDTAIKSFKVYDLPTVNAGPDLFVLEGGNTRINATYTGDDNIYVWSPNTYLSNSSVAQPITAPLIDITYTISVSNPGGCSASDIVFVKVLKAPNIPNTFSPNGDGINERWIIEYLDTYPNCKVMVFTRAGQKVFESRGYKTPWNGTLNGKSLPMDTYYYIIEPENGRKPITGYVTIIK